MRSLRIPALVFIAAVVLIAFAAGGRSLALFVSQRDQIAVDIIINVTPPPVVYKGPSVSPDRILTRVQMRAEGSGERFDALPAPRLVAQNTPQQPVKVQAEVTPNPYATLLYSNVSFVTVNAVAGTTVTVKCAYTVTASTTVSYFQLYHGLSNDFASNFPGGDVANNTYISTATPQPTSTPFVVYADDGGKWALLGTNGYKQTYCVDLTVTVPIGVTAPGTYSSNAVYTIYF
jgi:hypothetical protein